MLTSNKWRIVKWLILRKITVYMHHSARVTVKSGPMFNWGVKWTDNDDDSKVVGKCHVPRLGTRNFILTQVSDYKNGKLNGAIGRRWR
jgi:hypothetical protein